MRFLEDFILFNNPDRERWESTRENIERFQLKEGMTIADVGSGPGYYSFKFSALYAIISKVPACYAAVDHAAVKSKSAH